LAKRVGRFWTVRNIVNVFLQMGCEHHIAEPCEDDADGSFFGVSYLLNPDNKAFVPLVDLGDDEEVSILEVESWERRLGIEIPKPPE
jgi:hypothetical protein